MGNVYENIILRNAIDVGMANNKSITKDKVREVSVRALADTGAITLVINDELCTKLGLQIVGARDATLGNNKKSPCKITGPVEIQWKDRTATCQALVTSQSGEVLLGAIPLEFLDLMVNPVNQTLVGVNGDEIVYSVK